MRLAYPSPGQLHFHPKLSLCRPKPEPDDLNLSTCRKASQYEPEAWIQAKIKALAKLELEPCGKLQPGGRVVLSLGSADYNQVYTDQCTGFVELKYKRSFDQTGAR